MTIEVKLWPILVDFTMILLLFSNHVIAVANFEKCLISPCFLLNFKKSSQISKNSFKSPENYGQRHKDPLA